MRPLFGRASPPDATLEMKCHVYLCQAISMGYPPATRCASLPFVSRSIYNNLRSAQIIRDTIASKQDSTRTPITNPLRQLVQERLVPVSPPVHLVIDSAALAPCRAAVEGLVDGEVRVGVVVWTVVLPCRQEDVVGFAVLVEEEGAGVKRAWDGVVGGRAEDCDVGNGGNRVSGAVGWCRPDLGEHGWECDKAESYCCESRRDHIEDEANDLELGYQILPWTVAVELLIPLWLSCYYADPRSLHTVAPRISCAMLVRIDAISCSLVTSVDSAISPSSTVRRFLLILARLRRSTRGDRHWRRLIYSDTPRWRSAHLGLSSQCLASIHRVLW